MKHFMIAAALAAAFFLSCTKEKEVETGLESLSFSVSNIARTTLSGSSILFEASDRISVFDGTGKNRTFVTRDGGAQATFSGEAVSSPEYTLLYPCDPSASVSGSVIKTSVPSTQTLVQGSFGSGANLSCAVVSGYSVLLRNVCAIAKFTMAPSLLDITSVRFESAAGEPVAGPVSIDLSSGLPTCSAGAGALSYLNVVPASAVSKGTFYFTLIPGTLSKGFKLIFKTSDGKVLIHQGNKPAVFTRSNILDLGTVDLSSLIVVEEEPDDPSDDPVSAYASDGVDFSKLAAMGHPRLFLTAADFASLKERVVTNPDPDDIAVKLHRTLMNRAASSAASSEIATHTLVGKRLLSQSRAALERMFRCAYAYRMTGEEKYLTKARTELNAVCNPAIFPDWNAAKHFLDPSEMALAVAVVYDWLYYELTLEERTAAHAALKNYELTPFRTYTTSGTNNWNMVCNGGAIAAAIAIYEKDKALAAYDIDKAINSNLKAAEYYYDPNGNGLEGNGYWSYAMSYQIVIINALETAFRTSCGLADLNGFRKSGPWKLFMTAPTGGFNFSDSSTNTLSSTFQFIWLAARLNMPELLVREWTYLETDSYSSDRLLPIAMCGLARYPFEASKASFPSEKIWTANDLSPLVLVRLGWKYDDSDKFVGLKGSGAINGHAHMDAGEFVYDAFGVRWACDSKMGDYNTYEQMLSGLFTMTQTSNRWEILTQNSYFHNTLAFTWADGSVSKSNVTDQVVGSRGSVLGTFADETRGYGGTVDISCYYKDAASSVKRTVKLTGEELHVIDEITSLATHSAPFEWRMLTECDVTVEDGYVALKKGGKTIYLYAGTSDNVISAPVYGYEPEIVRPATWTQRDWDQKYNNFKSFHVVKYASEVASGKKTATFTTIFSPLKPSERGTYPSSEKPDFDDSSDAKW